MFEKTRVKIVARLLKRGQFMLASVLPLGGSDFACAALLSVDNDVLTEMMDKTMETHKEIREWILGRASTYLKRREIETKYFIEEITK